VIVVVTDAGVGSTAPSVVRTARTRTVRAEQDESSQTGAGDGPIGCHGPPSFDTWAVSAFEVEYLSESDSPPLLLPSEQLGAPFQQSSDWIDVSGSGGGGDGGGGGGDVGGGGAGGGVATAATTTAVGGEEATVEPFLLVAMTVTRNVFPTSAAVRV
jgi:hypothetical protein